MHVRRQAIKLGYDLRVHPSKAEQPSARSAPCRSGLSCAREFEAEDGEVYRVRANEQIADPIQELDNLLGDDAEEEDEATEHKKMGDE